MLILQLMKSLYAHDVIDDLPLSVFWKQNYCGTLLRNMKSHIESMYCIETGRR